MHLCEVIERLHPLDTIPHPVLVVERLLGGPTSKTIRVARSVMYDMVDLGFILDLHIIELIASHAEEYSPNVVEPRKPHLASMITDSHRNDVPILRLLVATVTFFTSPSAIVALSHLFVAPGRWTSRIYEIIGLDVHDSSARRKEVGLVRHAKLSLLDIENGSHLIAIDRPARTGCQSRLSV